MIVRRITFMAMVALASFVFIVGGSTRTIGQARLNQQEVIPKTPTAASFEKFISNPVDLHTGKQNVSLPIHTLTVGKLSIPIVLRYNSSGMKVDEVADFVGLGWNLAAGGVVSSNVNGIPDEIGWSNGYYAKISNPASFVNKYSVDLIGGVIGGEDHLDGFTGGDIDFLRGAYRGNWDSQPDTYFFSTPGFSGKFFFDENDQAHTIPYSKNKITRNLQYSPVMLRDVLVGYTIIDESGNKFEFKAMEYSETATSNGCNPEGTPSQVHRSFHLTKITTPEGDTIDYFYSDFNYRVKNPDSGSRSKVTPTPIAECTEMVFYPCITTSTTYFTGAKRLDRITTSRGDEVKFSYQPEGVFRKDLPNAKALESIDISKQGMFFKRFLFAYDYFYSTTSSSTNPDDFRLKLLSFREENKDPYLFQYVGGNPPNRLSQAKDHWGFSNVTGTLFPFDKNVGFDGGLREPDLTQTQIGVLKRVTYPTKGYLEFEYELNDYFVDESHSEPVNVFIAGLDSQPESTVRETFTVPDDAQVVYISWMVQKPGEIPGNIHNDWISVKLYGPNNSVTELEDFGDEVEFFLTRGAQYYFEITVGGDQYNASVGAAYRTQKTVRTTENRNAGGLRVFRTKNYQANGGVSLETIYQYHNGQAFGTGQKESSGILFYEPIYVTNIDRSYRPSAPGYGNCTDYGCRIITQSSFSLTPTVNSQGTHIVYEMVTVLNKDTTLGREVHKFLVDYSNNRGWIEFPYAPFITYDWLNGLPDEDVVYDANDNFVSKTKYYYNYTSIDSRPYDPNEKVMYGVKVDLIRLPLYCPDNETITNIEFIESRFNLISSWHYLKSKEESRRDIEGQIITTTTDYFYDDPVHIQKTSEQTTDSKGRVHRTDFTYPLDYGSDVMSGTMGTLNTANIITPVVSTIEVVDNLVVGSVVNELNAMGNPVSVYQLEASRPLSDFLSPSKNPMGLFTSYVRDSRYKKRVSFLYNAKQDVVEISNAFGDVTAYLWGYQGSHPIAEIKNATYNQVSSALGITLLNDLYANPYPDADIRSKLSLLRSTPSLSAARSTVITYHPNGAISSMTDPNGRMQFFFFDNANRLESIKDHNQNIISAFKYHYKDLTPPPHHGNPQN